MGKSCTTENYYDILNVRCDCSDKDIKAAYVKLSKKFHPDVKSTKSDSQKTAHFLKIAEAYQTLSKTKLRSEYDRNMQNAKSMRTFETSASNKNEFVRPSWEIKPDYDPNPGPYYGIKGLNRTTNSKVALAVIVLGIFSAVFGFVSVRHSFSLNQKRLDDLSARASEHHRKILTEVQHFSKDEQLRHVIDRIENEAKR